MKKSVIFVLTLVLAICLPLHLNADNDRVITFDRLPATAQAMLKQNFADKTPLAITADRDDYKVMYQSGEKVEFDKKGNWKDIECKGSQVPANGEDTIFCRICRRFLITIELTSVPGKDGLG